MPLENDFLVWAAASGANVETQSAFAADAALGPGVSAGTARAALYNKVARQSSIMAAMLAAFIQQELPEVQVLDTGVISSILINFTAALTTLIADQYVITSNSNGICREASDGFKIQRGVIGTSAGGIADVSLPVNFVGTDYFVGLTVRGTANGDTVQQYGALNSYGFAIETTSAPGAGSPGGPVTVAWMACGT